MRFRSEQKWKSHCLMLLKINNKRQDAFPKAKKSILAINSRINVNGVKQVLTFILSIFKNMLSTTGKESATLLAYILV